MGVVLPRVRNQGNRDIESKIESKLPLKEVRSLALDAQRLVFEGLSDKKEEKESLRYSLASSERVS